MENIVQESKLAKKLRLRADSLTEEEKQRFNCVKAERAERVSTALADSLARDTLFYERQRGLARFDPNELALATAEAEEKTELERLHMAELRLSRKILQLRRAFSAVSDDKLTRHAALRMIERNIQIDAVVKRSVTVIGKPVRDGKNAVIITTYPQSGVDSM